MFKTWRVRCSWSPPRPRPPPEWSPPPTPTRTRRGGWGRGTPGTWGEHGFYFLWFSKNVWHFFNLVVNRIACGNSSPHSSRAWPDELSWGPEDLHAAVAWVRHDDEALCVHGEALRGLELRLVLPPGPEGAGVLAGVPVEHLGRRGFGNACGRRGLVG